MTTNPHAHHRYLSDDDEHENYTPVGVDGLLAATEKLLAVNRGLAEPDDRDSLPNDRVYTVDRLIAERIKLDHGRTLRSMMGRLSRAKNLGPVGADAFGEYTVGFIKSNPLVPALEEINPMHNLEQKRRITKMGPGGIGDPNAITESMQAVQATQFGFVDPIAGPECHCKDTEVFTRRGWVFWEAATIDDEFACRVGGELQFHKAERLVVEEYEGWMHGVASSRSDFLVTPDHRFFSASSYRTSESRWKWETASGQVGKHRVHLCVSGPYAGTDSRDMFTLDPPALIPRGHRAREIPPIDMGDWCEFLGWYMSEGSCAPEDKGKKRHYSVVITQSLSANPEYVSKIDALLDRLPFGYSFKQGKNFILSSKALWQFLMPFGKCGEKSVPEFLYEVNPEYRQRFLDAFLAGDGWLQTSGSRVYSSSSEALVEGIERLTLLQGKPSTRGEPWRSKCRDGSPASWMYRVNELTSPVFEVKPAQQLRVRYSGKVYCATVPGSLLLTRRGPKAKPIWSGNSEKAGIDVRLAHGTRVGSDGRIYQLLLNRKTGKKEWVSPSKLRGKTLKLPD